MARNLENLPNVTPPSGDYPNGRIKDDTGANDGTPVDEESKGDLHQFFAKLMRDAGISPNDLPDNVSNGFQLNQALNKIAISPQLAYHGLFNESFAAGEITTGSNIIASFVSDTAIYGLDLTPQIVLQTINNKKEIIGPAVNFGSAVLNTPSDIYVDEVNNRAYVTDTTNQKVNVFDTSTGLNVPAEEFSSAALTPFPVGIQLKDGKAYVVDRTAQVVRVFNVSTLAHIPAEDFGNAGFLPDPSDIFIQGDKAYIPNDTGSQVVVYQVSTQSHLAADTFGSSFLTNPINVHVYGDKAYVVDLNVPRKVFVVDLLTGKELINEHISLTNAVNVFVRNNVIYIPDLSVLKAYKQNFDYEMG